ncbi:MAG: hypothetical protein Q9162_001719, partial [Coniocarpon cinnabarinum]
SPYPYCPNAPTATAFAILYLLVTIYAFIQYFRLKAWFFYWMLIALLGEVIGLAARAVMAKNLTNRPSFIAQYILIIVCPSLMAAACYMAFGRLVWYVSPYSKLNFRSLWVPPRWITPIFVSFDAITFFIQMVGVSAAATAIHGPGDVNIDQLNNGLRTCKIGLILQMVCFLFFAIIGMHFLIVSKRWSVPPSRARKPRWQLLNLAINAAATLITLRALYRIFEFSASVGSPDDQHGFTWYLYSNEWPAYVLDSLFILLSVIVMNVIHPGEFLPEDFVHLRLNKKNVRRAKETGEHNSISYPMDRGRKNPDVYAQGVPQQQAYAHLYPRSRR